MENKDERRMIKVDSYISKFHMQKLLYHSNNLDISISRLIGIAIDNELFESEKPFDWNFKIPEGEFVEYAYADQAGKILNYLRGLRVGMSLDMLLLMRHDIGIPNRDELLHGLRECVEKDFLEIYEPKQSPKRNNSLTPPLYYRLKNATPIARKKILKKAKTKAQEYAEYEKLKKKFEGK